MARSTKKLYTELVHAQIVAAARNGAPIRFVAAASGLAPRTLRKWLAAGARAAEAEDDGEECLATEAQYSSLWRDVERGRAEFVLELMGQIRTGEKGWQAYMTMLERLFPEEFSLTTLSRQESVVTSVSVQIGDPKALTAAHDFIRSLQRPEEIESGS